MANVVAKNIRFGIKTGLGSRCLCYFLAMGHGQNSLSFSFPTYKTGLYFFFLRLCIVGTPAIALTVSPSTHSLLRVFQPQRLWSPWIWSSMFLSRAFVSAVFSPPQFLHSSFLLQVSTQMPLYSKAIKTAMLPLLPAWFFSIEFIVIWSTICFSTVLLFTLLECKLQKVRDFASFIQCWFSITVKGVRPLW